MFRGAGTVINVVAILVGASLGVLAGNRLPERVRDVVTDALGLVTLLAAALAVVSITDEALVTAVGSGALLVVLGALVIGGVTGSLLRIEERLDGLGDAVRRMLMRVPGLRGRRVGSTVRPSSGNASGSASPELDEDGRRFVDGFVTASLVFCVGPLAILGSLSDGLGLGIDQLALKSSLDFFAAIAFAASLGWGVAASALAVGVYQGALTVVGVLAGGVIPAAGIAATTATGGLLLVGIGLRLLRVRAVPVGDLLPALVAAPLIVAVVSAFRGG